MTVQTGATGGDAAGQQQGQGAGTGSLLGDEAEHQHQQEQNGGTEQTQGGTGQTGTTEQQAPAPLTLEQVQQAFESGFDRRINAVLREVRGQGQNGQQQQQQGQPQGGTQVTNIAPPVSTGPTPADLREARTVYREYVGDEIRFLGNDERDLAQSLATGLLASRLATGEDPETAGAAVAKEIAKQITTVRKSYEDRTIAALKRRGQLPESGQGSGQPLKGPAKPGDTSGYAAGAAKAQTMFGDRRPAATT